MKCISYIRMDFHKNTHSLCEIHSSLREVIAQTKCSVDVKNILKFMTSVKKKLSEENEVEIVAEYEIKCFSLIIENYRIFVTNMLVSSVYYTHHNLEISWYVKCYY